MAAPTTTAESLETGATKRARDPLVLLREHTVANNKVTWVDDYLEFIDGARVHRSAKCGYRLTPRASLLDIGSIWFMLKEISHDRSYTKDICQKRAFEYINVASRSDLCDYLVGRMDACRGLVLDVIEGRKRPHNDGLGAGIQWPKKARTEDDGKALTGTATAAPTEELSYQDVAARVRPVKDLDVLVRCPGRTVPNADLILKIAQDESKNWHQTITQAKRIAELQPEGGHIPLHLELEEILRKNKDDRPIILVPCNKNAPVNMLNVADLLQNGNYERPSGDKLRYFEASRSETVDVSRNIGGKLWTFEVRDSAKNFTKAQWLRTVAVVTDGTDWQFKGWPFESVVDMFCTMRGCFFQANGVPVPVHVHNWQVQVISMAPSQMVHHFRMVRDQFFFELEAFMNTCRQKKFVNHTTLDTVGRIIIKPLPML